MLSNNSGKDGRTGFDDSVIGVISTDNSPKSGFSSLCHPPALLCFTVMALMLAARLLADGLLSTLAAEVGAVPLLITVNLAAFLLPTLVFFLIYRKKDSAVLKAEKSRGSLRYIVSSLFLLIVCAMLTQSLRCYWFGAPVENGARFSEIDTVPLLFCYAILPAVLEECLFRGAVLRFYTARCGGLCAVLISAVLFSLSHFSGEDFLSYFISGLILGFTAYVTGSLAAVTALHLINNIFSLYLENAVFKIATESKSIVLMVFLLTALALLLLFWTLYEAEILCKGKFLSAPKKTEEALPQDISAPTAPHGTESGFTRLIPQGQHFGQALLHAVLSPFFLGCILIFLVYTLLIA